jgi:hypothetical protein
MGESIGERKANNAGLVTTTAGPDLCHTLPLGRTVKIKKVMWYNNTGAAQTLIFGTQTNVAGWVPLFPTINCVNTMDGELMEWELPDVKFQFDTTAAAGTTGNILVQGSAVGILVRLEVEELG